MCRRRLAPALLLGASLLPACGTSPPADGGTAPGTQVQPSAGCRPGAPLPAVDAGTFDVDRRRILLDAPAAAADRPLPLLLVFHGFRSSPDDLRAGTGLPALARDEHVIVAYPEGRDGVELLETRGRGWDVRPGQTTDRDFVRALLARLEDDRCIDRNRIYAAGFSNGGFLASLLGCQLADRLAGVAAIAGGSGLGSCTPSRPVPILFLYGRADQVVAVELVRDGIEWWARRNRCRGSTGDGGCRRWQDCAAPVEACEGDQGHRWPRDATASLWRFLAPLAVD